MCIDVVEIWFGKIVFFFTSDEYYNLWSCQNVCEAFVYLFDNIFIRFWTKLYRQFIAIPMGINCARLVADLFLFCYERDFKPHPHSPGGLFYWPFLGGVLLFVDLWFILQGFLLYVLPLCYYTPNFEKKVGEHIASDLSVRSFVRSFVFHSFWCIT